MSNLAQTIEALLFALGKPMTRTDIVQKLNVSAEEIDAALGELTARNGGIVVVDDGMTIELRTAPETSGAIEQIRKDEYSRDIGRAGLEALAALLYRGPLSRAEIDFIRGVNSTQTLRTLTMRGLIRKTENSKDSRSFTFEPTTELLAVLGVTHISDLPDYAVVRDKLEALEKAYRNQEEHNDTEQ
ncbi:MAG: scpB [Candidatus Adlerbacteria bacterium]|nr:scpB [Candidatus Adlerbacteria bacterium]